LTALIKEKPTAIAKHDGIEQIEAAMLNMEQADCPVAHHFGPGIYVREVTLPKGIIAVGHSQRFEHLNIMLTGKVAMVDGDRVRVLEAPMIFVGQPGRKVGYVMETCVWQNIYATDETDIDTLEATFLDKSDTWLSHEEDLKVFRHASHQDDRDDFFAMLGEVGFDPETVRQQSENEPDQIPMPSEWATATSVRESDIEGQGLFLSWPVPAETIIAPARINGFRTPAGRFVNHAKNPNCKFVKVDNGDIYLVAIANIRGCAGGTKGDELTVDYRQALSLSGIGENKPCQE
jgi:hypothetical protein